MSQERTVHHAKDQPDDKTGTKPVVSPLTIDKTYGERKYNFVFGKLINFWLNLTVSAAFSFWVAHSTRPVKIPFVAEKVTPRGVQQNLTEWINKRGFMKTIADDGHRFARSRSMATVMTLLIPGHFIMIPSVWLGAKIKPWFVKREDRKHYGDASMDDPSIQARHAAIEVERRPTLLGAVFGRAGTVAMTQLAARGIGDENNWAQMLGNTTNIKMLQKFKGIDPFAENLGESFGKAVEDVAPGTTAKLNKHYSAPNYDWSEKQKSAAAMSEFTSKPYNHAVRNYSRYVGQDVMYTLITASTVHPIMNFLNKFLPGMTYKPKVSAETQQVIDKLEGRTPPLRHQRRAHTAHAELETSAAPTAEAAPEEHTPHTKVSHVTPHERVKEHHHKDLQA